MIDRARARDDRGSLPLAMLITLVGVGLSAVLGPMVVRQVQSSRVAVARSDALHAAQAGIDAALGQIRAARDPVTGAGDRRLLPCAPNTRPLTGTVAGTAYTVEIQYYEADPGIRQADQRGTPITCVPGIGTQDTPAFVLLLARGTDADGTIRRLEATYPVRTHKPNITGGPIKVYNTDLCLDAGSSTPPDGTPLRAVRCVDGSEQQKFAYTDSLNLTVAPSRGAPHRLGMCVDAGPGRAHAEGLVLQLWPCEAVTDPRQQWSFNDNSNFEGTRPDGSGLSGFCLNTTGSAGSVFLSRRCNGTWEPRQTFEPTSATGAGAAAAGWLSGGEGLLPSQLVNLGKYGTCMDAPLNTVGGTPRGYMMAWPCKQTPRRSTLRWNQVWTWERGERQGRITTTSNAAGRPYPAGVYCLKSPGSTALGQYADIELCPTGTVLPRQFRWTVYRERATYEASYRIHDDYGYCLQPADPAAVPAEPYFPAGQQVSRIVVGRCAGTELQKWNAPLPASPVRDFREE